MNKEKSMNIIGEIVLLLITIAWGSSFIILKNTIDALPMFYVLGFRFLISSIILGLVFIKKIKKSTKKNLLHGFVLGVCLALAYATQTIGLKYTTASRNAFITAFYCVLVPFLAWLLLRRKPTALNLISAVVCVVGIGLVALSGDSEKGSNMLLGDGITLSCSLFYGLQIVFTSRFQSEGDDSTVLLIVELFTVGVLFSLTTLVYELPTYGIEAYKFTTDSLLSILYLTFICTLFAQAGQIFGIKYTKPLQATLILSLESVFGTLFAIIIGDERLSGLTIFGFALVFISILLNELLSEILKSRKTSLNTKMSGGKEDE